MAKQIFYIWFYLCDLTEFYKMSYVVVCQSISFWSAVVVSHVTAQNQLQENTYGTFFLGLYCDLFNSITQLFCTTDPN